MGSMTRLDKVKEMTAEKFADWLDNVYMKADWCNPNSPVDPETNMCLFNDGDCAKCITNWLKEELK